ncbi:MAG: phospholipase D-like domain-containing protein [bacterium]
MVRRAVVTAAVLWFFAVSGARGEEGVRLLMDGEYFKEVHRILRGAGKSIHIAVFSIRRYAEYPDSPSNVLIRDLVEARGRGVEVYVVINVDRWKDDNAGNIAAGRMLEEGGVSVRYDSLEKTSHAKLLTVDGEVSVVGSTNWSYHSLAKNREANVLIEDEETAAQVREYIRSIR